jgi:hypothetical protein
MNISVRPYDKCFSICDPWITVGPRRSAGCFGGKGNVKIVSDTEIMKNTSMYVCAKTAYVGWPSTERRRISFYHNLMSLIITKKNTLN